MKTYTNLWGVLVSESNLQLAYEKASKHKSFSSSVRKFDKDQEGNLKKLLEDLRNKTYRQTPLLKFVLRDPKTRIICVSEFRDRIVHHMVVNVLQPILEPKFIHDSYASRKGKGTLPAVKRFDFFLGKASHNGQLRKNARNNNDVCCYVLKADIKKYFENVDKQILLKILERHIKDVDVLWLVRVVLDNYSASPGKGMPLGNWTSQFFANVYLNELDQFVKHKLKVKYYIRYVDDVVILHSNRSVLEGYRKEIEFFLRNELALELHPQKTRIALVKQGINLLGYRVFYHYKLVRQKNMRRIRVKLNALIDDFMIKLCNEETILAVLHGWNAYAMHGNTYCLRKELTATIKQKLKSERKSLSALLDEK